MKKFIGRVSLFIYFIFSQFVLKAWATIDWQVVGSEDYCESKKFKNFEGKFSCWKEHNIADIHGISNILENITYEHPERNISDIFVFESNKAYLAPIPRAQRPPGDIGHAYFLKTQWFGSILLLI